MVCSPLSSPTNAVYSLRSSWRYAERWASAAAGSRSDVGAEAVSSRLQAVVRRGMGHASYQASDHLARRTHHAAYPTLHLTLPDRLQSFTASAPTSAAPSQRAPQG